MAGEIQLAYLTGRTLYAHLRTATGTIWNGSSFEAYATANIATYDIALTEQGTASAYYIGTFPAAATGAYNLVAYVQLGGSPAEGDTLIAAGQVEWDGSAVVPLSSRLAPTTAGRTLDVAATGEAGLDFNNVLSSALVTLHSLTVTNAFTISDGLIVNTSTTNRSAIAATGNGTGSGIHSLSGTADLAKGMYIQSQSGGASGGNGLVVEGVGGGAGLRAVQGTTGIGISTDGLISGGAVTLNTTLTVSGTTTLAAVSATTITTSGTVTFNAFTVTNAFTVSGATTFTGVFTASAGFVNTYPVGAYYPSRVVDSGTAQSATATTLVLRAAAAFANDELNGTTIVIRSATTGAGQCRLITDYDSATDTATVATWTTTPTGTIVYDIFGTASGVAAPTAAEVATAVWQDATAGDFTVASSIGKALYIANVVPGGIGGHLISGSNAGTTTLGALIVTGSTNFEAVAADGISLGSAGLSNVGVTSLASVTTSSTVTLNALTITNAFIVSGTTTFTGVFTASAGFVNTYPAGAYYPSNVVDSGTAQSATGTTLVLRAAAAFADSELVGATVVIRSATAGAGQRRVITANVSATDTITVDTWTTTPTGTIVYDIVGTAPFTATLPASVNVTQWLGTAVSTPTVAGVPNVNVKTWNDLTTVDLPLAPTTAGRKLDVTATGAAGIDWNNVENQTATVSLVGTTVAVTTNVAGDVQGSVFGNVNGSIGGLTAAALKDFFDTNSTTTYAVAVAGSVVKEIADNALGGAAGMAAAVWNAATASYATAGSFGLMLGTTLPAYVDTEVAAIKVKTDQLTFSTANRVDSQVFGMEANTVTAAAVATGAIDADAIADNAIDAGALAADCITAAKIADGAIDAATFASGAITATAIATDAIGAAEFATSAVNKVADQVWDELIAGHLGAGSTGEALNAAGSSGDPWVTVLPGAYGAGSAGYLLGNGLKDADGVSVNDILKQVLSMASGRILESPAGTFTYYARDNATPLFVLTVTGVERTRA